MCVHDHEKQMKCRGAICHVPVIRIFQVYRYNKFESAISCISGPVNSNSNHSPQDGLYWGLVSMCPSPLLQFWRLNDVRWKSMHCFVINNLTVDSIYDILYKYVSRMRPAYQNWCNHSPSALGSLKNNAQNSLFIIPIMTRKRIFSHFS